MALVSGSRRGVNLLAMVAGGKMFLRLIDANSTCLFFHLGGLSSVKGWFEALPAHTCTKYSYAVGLQPRCLLGTLYEYLRYRLRILS